MNMKLPMLILYLSLFVSFVRITSGQDLIFKFHQDDYDIQNGRIDLIWINNTYFKNLRGNLVIREKHKDRPLTLEGWLLKSFTSETKIDLKVLKLRNGEYRYFPLTADLSLCREIEINAPVLTELLKNKILDSNIPLTCPIEPDHYYFKIVPDFSILPPFMPRGSYKVIGKFYHKSDYVMEVDVLGTVVDKPTQTNNTKY